MISVKRLSNLPAEADKRMGQQDCPIYPNIARKLSGTQAAISRNFDIKLLNSQFVRKKISETQFFSFRVKPYGCPEQVGRQK
jgi:hypothetical protein